MGTEAFSHPLWGPKKCVPFSPSVPLSVPFGKKCLRPLLEVPGGLLLIFSASLKMQIILFFMYTAVVTGYPYALRR